MTAGHPAFPSGEEQIAASYRTAMLAHQSGQFAEALAGYTAVLSMDAKHAGASYLLGVVYRQLGDTVSAERYWRQAIAWQAEPTFMASLAELLCATERLAEAITYYRRIVELRPGDADAHCNLGSLLRRCGKLPEAEQSYRRSIDLKPDLAESHYNLGNLLEDTQRPVEAEQAYRTAIDLRPDLLGALNNLGMLLMRNNRLQEAQPILRAALALAPHDGALHYNLANLLLSENDAIGAETAYRDALRCDPKNSDARFNLSRLLQVRGYLGEAEAGYREVIAQRPEDTDASWNLSLLLLREGRCEEGWALYESRYAGPRGQRRVDLPDLPMARWSGDELAGRTILVCCEQGLGDAIQFARYVPLLKARGAARVGLLCPAPLADLFGSLPDVDEILVDAEQAGSYDCFVALLSLPRHFATTLATLPAHLPYLAPRPDLLRRWSARLHRAGLRVGLVWRGQPGHTNDRHRSLPSLATLAPLFAIPDVCFVSLQTGDGATRELADFPDIVALGQQLRDFSDTAAVVTQLDLVITVDTATAHLAGALGIPCWLLLPATGCDWRWLRERNDSPWYPNVMRLFRQAASDDWTPQVAELRNELLALTAQRDGPGRAQPAPGTGQHGWATTTDHVFFVHSPITYSIALAAIAHLGLANPIIVGARGLHGGRVTCAVDDEGGWSIARCCTLLRQIARQLTPSSNVIYYAPHSGFLFGKLMTLSGRVVAINYLEEGHTSAQAPLLKQALPPTEVAANQLSMALAEDQLCDIWQFDPGTLAGINDHPDYFFDCTSPKYRGAYACSPDAFVSVPWVTRLALPLASERRQATLTSIRGIRNCCANPEEIAETCLAVLEQTDILRQARNDALTHLIKLHPADISGLPTWFYQRLCSAYTAYAEYCQQHGLDPNVEPALLNFAHYHVIGRTSVAKYVTLFLGQSRLTQV